MCSNSKMVYSNIFEVLMCVNAVFILGLVIRSRVVKMNVKLKSEDMYIFCNVIGIFIVIEYILLTI